MKAVKLKPLLLSKNEILVKPPEFILNSMQPVPDSLKSCIIISMAELRPHLQQRKISKEMTNKKPADTEEDSVKKLSEWKRSASPNSPLLRKYTFRRLMTINSLVSESNSKIRKNEHAGTQAPQSHNLLKLIASKVHGIVALERLKKKTVDESFQKISNQNQEIENSIKGNIEKVSKEISGLKNLIIKNKAKIEEIKNELNLLQKAHENNLRNIKIQEIEEVMFKDRSKLQRSGDEGQYLIYKEKMRKLKQEIHKKFVEDLEYLKQALVNTEKNLENNEYERQKNKKDLKGLKEEISHLYLRILKEGKDLRTEGLRWVIKSLWKLNQYIPLSAFPKFLDEDSIYYLFLISSKDLECEFLHNKLEKMRQALKNRKANVSISSAKELYSNVKKRLREMSKSVISYPIDGNSSVDIEEMRVIESRDNYCEVGVYRNRINQIVEKMKEETDSEVKRITEIYQLNPGSAEKIGLFHLIKCLVGDKVREFNKYTRLQEPKNKRSTIITLQQ